VPFRFHAINFVCGSGKIELKAEYLRIATDAETDPEVRGFLVSLLAKTGDVAVFDPLYEAAAAASGRTRENILISLRVTPRNGEFAKQAAALLESAGADDLQKELLIMLAEEGSSYSTDPLIRFVENRGSSEVAGYDPLRFLIVGPENQERLAAVAESSRPGNDSALLALMHSSGTALLAGLKALDHRFSEESVAQFLQQADIHPVYSSDLVETLQPIAQMDSPSASRRAARMLLDGMRTVNYDFLN